MYAICRLTIFEFTQSLGFCHLCDNIHSSPQCNSFHFCHPTEWRSDSSVICSHGRPDWNPGRLDAAVVTDCMTGKNRNIWDISMKIEQNFSEEWLKDLVPIGKSVLEQNLKCACVSPRWSRRRQLLDFNLSCGFVFFLSLMSSESLMMLMNEQ